MASPLPLRPSIEHTPRRRTAFRLGEDDTPAVLEALASETARSVLLALAEEPRTASDLAGAVDTSLQNVHYHLNNLLEAGLVTGIGTWYSAKGKEMTVYAPSSEGIELQFEPVDGEADRSARQEGNVGPSRSSVATASR